ncbi:response regulator transcription factor [Enterococcus sp. RIT-PI-f]|uniref:response regulator transcription factor n=1 Tax=Enterococcus sp. RIT-PI-f TaxID=1690244 RepID=UPI0006B8EA5A|nr:response regulator transcription factor [Enterococcus sp. RIT-PI-f]KPG70636.1 hypothetical protein AEQ18_08750 [Enterococcus sp. RIT-PI-f]
MAVIMVVEDDENIKKLMVMYLNREGYQVIEANDGSAALKMLAHTNIDLMVSDIAMPSIDGYSLTQSIRDAHYDFPIMMVTAKERFEDKKRGFLSGADDYMVKPIDLEEMVLRVSALLRRAKINADNKIEFGEVLLDKESLVVRTANQTYNLPQKEFMLLFKLLSYPSKIFTRQELMEDIWGYDSETDYRTIDVHIKRLRDKFGQTPDFSIETVKGLGYRSVKKDETS